MKPPLPPIWRNNVENRPLTIGVEDANDDDANAEDQERILYVPKQRLIHFDLKGAPPKVDYLIKVLTLSKTLGATGVLMEYEDMFPFSGKLAGIAAKNHYTVEQIKLMLDKCEELGLEVIPLVQTFGKKF